MHDFKAVNAVVRLRFFCDEKKKVEKLEKMMENARTS
jgi:hypothetical protein